MGAIKDLWNSEKGITFLLLVGIVTLFVVTGAATFTDWREIVLPFFGIYAGTKTATTIGVALANRGQAGATSSASSSSPPAPGAPSTPPG